MSEDSGVARERGDFAEWAIVELMGHRKLAGWVTEVELAGAALLRIDVPATEAGAAVTSFVSATSIYCLTPVSEEVARAVAWGNFSPPVERWEWPRLGEASGEKTTASEGEFRYPDRDRDDPAAEVFEGYDRVR